MRKYIYTALLLLLLVCMSFVTAADDIAISEDADIESGIYTIKNLANGYNLNAFDIKYSENGYAYTDQKSGEEGENILVIKQEDGRYLLYPQSEGGKYAICMCSNGEKVYAGKSAEITDASYFNIYNAETGYVISGKDGMVLNGASGEKLYRKELVSVDAYSGLETQRWEFSAVELSTFELKTVAEEVKLYSVSSVYAITKPAYMKNLVKWTSNDESMLLIDDDGSFCALRAGTATVTATLAGISKSINIKIVDSDAFTWYSQHLASSGGWRGDELSGVYFYQGGSKRFIIDGYNRGRDWMDEGCALTSIAMVLHNLGARYNAGYDFRFDADGYLESDPYTVALANSGNIGLKSSQGTLYNNPIMVSIDRISSAFSLHGQPIKGMRTYGVTKEKLKKALDEHPEGVIVGMENTVNGSHFIVVTECLNPGASNPENYRFKIYDSAGLRRSHGDNVAFEKSISYDNMRYRYSHMESMIVFDIVDTEE